jgi:D-tyrosyl-tRNA(Tyr) deacylase
LKIVVQRVSRAEVTVDGSSVASIGTGLLLLVAVEREDTPADLVWSAGKVAGLRVFEDPAGKMNRDLSQVGGRVLAVSQFTLAGSVRRGRRPSFDRAAAPEVAEAMFDDFVEEVRRSGLEVQTGIFGAHMKVELLNDGPVTLILDSRERLAPRNA